MTKNFKADPIDVPLNSNERFLSYIAYRLDIIIEQNNSIIDFLSKQNKVTVTENTLELEPQVQEEKPKRKTSRKK